MKKSEINGYTFAVVDLLTALLVVFMALAVLALASVQKQRHDTNAAGDIIATLTWDKTADCDVDLWGLAPGETTPVGYSHRDGLHLNLLRDDLGHQRDPESRNTEIMVSRGAPAGEWVFNAVLYASYNQQFPVSVHLVVQDRHGNVIADVRDALTFVGEEITMVRFQLDTHGALVPASVNRLGRILYEGGRRG